MIDGNRLDALARGWRGRLLAALIALIAGLPGLVALPVTDRDEARFAQATAQMLETGDFVSINFQDVPRDKKPVGIHWLQAASVALVSSAQARHIWAYRIASVLGAVLAAGACAWGAEALFGSGAGLIAGGVLGASFILSTEASLATTDAVLCGATTLAMAAFGRIYGASKGIGAAGWRTKLLFWLGLALGTLVKGPIGPMVALLTGLALWICDRKAPWGRTLGWIWGLLLIVAVVGPWATAITVRTDGAFWSRAITGDLAPKLAGGQEGHGFPPGFHLLLLPLLFFPATVLLPAAFWEGWKARAEPGVRFALCWLIPSWIVFEAAPTKLPHYTLPLYGALAWLAAAGLMRPLGPWARARSAFWSILPGLALAGACAAVYADVRQGAAGDALAMTVLAIGLFVAAAAAGALVLTSRLGLAALAAALGLGVAAHAAVVAGELPALREVWVSKALARALSQAGLNPRDGLTPGPVTIAGYGEPSAVFLLGTETELGDVGDAAEAISEGRPAVVEAGQDAAFQTELAADKLQATQAGVVQGYDYSVRRPVKLILYRSSAPPTPGAQGAP
jgi:4-amino-4-deoxy-L-arabinose transferase-like glycosyltransferase